MPDKAQSRVNDFVLKLANVNGTGSASANSLLMKSIFRMGVPVVGKNYFPSNIQGLPTWYEVRVTRDAHMARAGTVDLMVAMNAQTYKQDLAEVAPGGYLLYDSTWPRRRELDRDDITVLGAPLAQLANENFDGARARILMKNVVYVGVLAALLDLDLDIVRQLLEQTFAAKPDLVGGNLDAIRLGYDYARANFDCPLPLRVEAMNATAGHIMIDGNTAAALGCLYAGATVGAWYPITPSTSLMDAFSAFCHRHRIDPETGEKNFFIIQAEDELAAIGMVVGASWAGARAFTPTSGPGISLMSEFLGFAYFTEIPLVLFNVQRVGPSTGMPTRTQQGDLLSCAFASHGDTRHVLLFPADPAECFTLAVEAFDLAERLQTPVMVLSDLDIGMNDWMVPELKWDDRYEPDRGKVLTAAEIEEMEVFYRYLDSDGDGICPRTFPGGHPRGAYFTRGSGHNERGQYTEDAAEYKALVDRLRRKWETARLLAPPPAIEARQGNRLAAITLGSGDGAAREAIAQLAARGIALDYLRVRSFPFSQEIGEFIDGHDRVYVIEQNRDAQLRTLLINDLEADATKLVPVLLYDGLPIACGDIVAGIESDVTTGAAA